jgi:hypothetical protein
MAKDFVVVRADLKEDWTHPQHGPFKCFTLELEEAPQGSGISHRAEMNQKPTSAPPAVGETLSGTITPNQNPDFPAKFKKEFKEGGSGGSWSPKGGTFKPRDPSEIAGARHAHNLLVAANSFQPLPIGYTPAEVQRRLDDLEAFACVLDEKTAAISDAAKGETKTVPKDGSDLPF